MAKGLGKVILTSGILAGAAIGSYMYFKREGVIDETKTPAENVQKIKSKVTSDAAEFFAAQDRNYVDLNDAEGNTEAAADKAADTVQAATDTAAETVKTTAQKAAETVEAVKEKAVEIADVVTQKASVVVEKAAEKVEEAKETFAPGLQADKIDTADSKTIGGSSSEEFFNDEQ